MDIEENQTFYEMEDVFTVEEDIVIKNVMVIDERRLAIAGYPSKSLFIFYNRGMVVEQIPLHKNPMKIAVINNSSVAVTLLRAKQVLIVNLLQKDYRKIKFDVECCSITCMNDKLFIGCKDETIAITNIQGNILRKISTPELEIYNICGTKKGLLFCTNYTKDEVICIDPYRETTSVLKNACMRKPRGITADDEDCILVSCRGSYNVCRISKSGKFSVVIEMEPYTGYPCICYDTTSDTVIIGFCNTLQF